MMLRYARNLDQGTATDSIVVSRSHLSRMETGAVASVSTAIAKKLAGFYGTSLDFTAGLEDDAYGTGRGQEVLAEDEVDALHLYRKMQDKTVRAAARAILRHLLDLDRTRC